MRARLGAIAMVATSFWLAASCRTKPTDEPEVPCCVNGFMASCHGRSDEPFRMCPDGHCVGGNERCPEVAPPADVPDATLDSAPDVEESVADAESSTRCERDVEALERRFQRAQACQRNEDCTTVGYACFGSCGRAISRSGLEDLKSALDEFQNRCAAHCPVPKCAPWVVNAPACRKGRCEIPRSDP